jgi:hypothetical protein
LNGTNVVVVFVIIFVGVRVDFNISTPNSGVVGPGFTQNILDYSVHLHQYGFDTGRLTSLKYKVKACSDVNVYLSNSLVMDSSMPLYEVSVGGYYNTKMLMLRRSDDSLQRETMIDVFPGGISTNADSDRLNCNKYMYPTFNLNFPFTGRTPCRTYTNASYCERKWIYPVTDNVNMDSISTPKFKMASLPAYPK